MTRVEWYGEEMMQKLIPSLNAGLTAAAAQMDNQAVVNFGRDGSPSTPGGVPGVDDGHLQKSIRHASPETMGTPLKAAFGTATSYGRYLEFGAHIRAKRTKYLAVPVNRQLAKTLLRKKSGGLSGGLFGTYYGGSLRDVPGLKYIPPPMGRRGGDYGGRLVLAASVPVHIRGTGKTRTSTAGETVFVLKKSVTVAARPWIWKAALESRTRANAAFHKVFTEHAKARGLLH